MPATRRVPGWVLTAWSVQTRDHAQRVGEGAGEQVFTFSPRYHVLSRWQPRLASDAAVLEQAAGPWLQECSRSFGEVERAEAGAGVAQATPSFGAEMGTDGSTSGLSSLSIELRVLLGELRAGFSDVALRYHAWGWLRSRISEHLWAAVEPLAQDHDRRQLADQLDVAVRRLTANQLTQRHLEAIDLTLDKLSAPIVTEEDVEVCRREWRRAGNELMPSLGDVVDELLGLYGDSEEDDA